MRLVCYLGTRGCPGILAEALRDSFDALAIAVPREPRLLGAHVTGERVEAGLEEVATLVARRAEARAIRQAEDAEERLTRVFDRGSDASERISARVLEPPIEAALVAHAGDRGAEACFVSRDGLDVIAEAGIPLVDELEARDIDLVTR